MFTKIRTPWNYKISFTNSFLPFLRLSMLYNICWHKSYHDRDYFPSFWAHFFKCIGYLCWCVFNTTKNGDIKKFIKPLISLNTATVDSVYQPSQLVIWIPHMFFREIVRKDILKGKQREGQYLNIDHLWERALPYCPCQ